MNWERKQEEFRKQEKAIIAHADYNKSVLQERLWLATFKEYTKDNFPWSCSEPFPGCYYESAKFQKLSEYEIISALKHDYERWTNLISEMPNSKGENIRMLDKTEIELQKLEEQLTECGLIGRKEIKRGISIAKSDIEKIKKLPNECRLAEQYKTKNNLIEAITNESNQDIKKALNRYLIEVCAMIDPDSENKKPTIENEQISNDKKLPFNTHKQQFALLEELGVVEFLQEKYNLPDTKMSELIANILNRSIQNTRVMLSLQGTKEGEANQQKNKDIIDPILIKTGIIKTA